MIVEASDRVKFLYTKCSSCGREVVQFTIVGHSIYILNLPLNIHGRNTVPFIVPVSTTQPKLIIQKNLTTSSESPNPCTSHSRSGSI